MKTIIEKENSDSNCIRQELKNWQDTESLIFNEVVIPNLTAPKKNDVDLSPRMDNLIAEIKSDLRNTAANFEQFEKCFFDVVSTQQSKVTNSKAYKHLESLELRIKLSVSFMNIIKKKDSGVLQQY